jgi:hypothetical protein
LLPSKRRSLDNVLREMAADQRCARVVLEEYWPEVPDWMAFDFEGYGLRPNGMRNGELVLVAVDGGAVLPPRMGLAGQPRGWQSEEECGQRFMSAAELYGFVRVRSSWWENFWLSLMASGDSEPVGSSYEAYMISDWRGFVQGRRFHDRDCMLGGSVAAYCAEQPVALRLHRVPWR